MAYESQADGSVRAHMNCPRLWQGYPGMVHGGIIASILDGAMTHCLFARDIAAVTADLHVRYRHPLLVDADAIVTARITREMAPVFVLEASIIQQDKIRCTATGKFMDRDFATAE
ncbi:MAG: thioesterase [Phycisphaeraceae bacterium]|nr:thioesterase [Phycisphaeraceae bacterium]